jgi:hypothetical protein
MFIGERMTSKVEEVSPTQPPQLPPLFQALKETLTNNCNCKVCKTVRRTLIRYGEEHNVPEVIRLKQKV